METRIETILQARGPLTGAELLEGLETDSLSLWRHCMGSARLIVRCVSRLYLRLDRRIEGFARLSPSILREFLTYSVIAPVGAETALEARALEISEHIRAVTREKSRLAYRTISALVSGSDNPEVIREKVCFLLAGDIVYDMAHDVPRPERSTGRLVRGSDLDLIVVVNDGFSDDHRRRLDDRIFMEKHSMLLSPQLREEIDYVVKDLDRIREQLRFDTFRRMVACKILQEGTFLYGSESLFTRIKKMFMESGVAERLKEMERMAGTLRFMAEETLLRKDLETIRRDYLHLFYPTEESEEFE
ncbi:MAG: hypothetical protein ACQET7_03990 [Thermodesulfobacteriota bacterium]